MKTGTPRNARYGANWVLGLVACAVALSTALCAVAAAADPCAAQAAYDAAKTADTAAQDKVDLLNNPAQKPPRTAKQLEDARQQYAKAADELKAAKDKLETYRAGVGQGVVLTKTPLADLRREEQEALDSYNAEKAKADALEKARAALDANPDLEPLKEKRQEVAEPLVKSIKSLMPAVGESTPDDLALKQAYEVILDRSYQKFDPSNAANSDQVLADGRALLAASEISNASIRALKKELAGYVAQAGGVLQGGPTDKNAWDEIKRVGGKLYGEIDARREDIRGQFVKLHEKEKDINAKKAELNPNLKKLEEDAPSPELLNDKKQTLRRARVRLAVHEYYADVDTAQKAFDQASAAAGNPSDLADLDAKLATARKWETDVQAAQAEETKTAAVLAAATAARDTAAHDITDELAAAQKKADLAGIDKRLNQTDPKSAPELYTKAKAIVRAAAKADPQDKLNVIWKQVKGNKEAKEWKDEAHKRIESAYQDQQKVAERQRLEGIRDPLKAKLPCLDARAGTWPALGGVKGFINKINETIREKLGFNVASLDLGGLVEVDAGPVPADFDFALDGEQKPPAGRVWVCEKPIVDSPGGNPNFTFSESGLNIKQKWGDKDLSGQITWEGVKLEYAEGDRVELKMHAAGDASLLGWYNVNCGGPKEDWEDADNNVASLAEGKRTSDKPHDAHLAFKFKPDGEPSIQVSAGQEPGTTRWVLVTWKYKLKER